MPLKPPPLPVGVALILAGLLLAAVSAIAALQLVGQHHNLAQNLAAPDAAELTLEPGVTHSIDRELAGPHITVNRPLLDPPDDLAITVTDADTGEPVPVQDWTWWSRQQFFGLARERRSIARFDPPAHGRVRVEITGSFTHEQIFAVGPTFDRYRDRYQTPLQIALILAALLVLAGLTLAILRVANPTPAD